MLATAAWLLIAGWGIGSYPLGEPDEGRNGTAALEVATEGRWLLPTYSGVELVDKPLLWFDAAALGLLVLGKGELAVRLPSLVFTGASLLLVAWFARRLYGREPAWVAAAAFATSPLVLTFARIAIFDAMVSFFVALALVLLHEAVEGASGEGPPGPVPARLAAGAWAAMALGFLTKGPVAVAVPLVVALPYALWRRRVRALWSWPGGLAFGALVTAWIASVEIQVRGFLDYVLVHEIWSRIVAPGAATVDLGTTGPIKSVLPILVLGALPWTVVAAWSWIVRWKGLRSVDRQARGTARRPHSTVFLVLWVTLPSLLFSLAQPLRLQYLLPVMPAVALLLAAAAARGTVTPGALRAGAATLLVLGGALGAAGTGVWPVLDGIHPSLDAAAHATGVALGVLLLAAPGVSVVLARRRPRSAGAALALPGLLLPLVTFPLLVQVAEARSSRDLAGAIEEGCPGAPVVGIEFLPASLPFYLGRPVGLASRTGEPFQSNYVAAHWETITGRDTGERVFARAWWKDLPERVVVVFERRDGEKRLGAVQRGFEELAVNRLFTVWGRGCAARSRDAGNVPSVESVERR